MTYRAISVIITAMNEEGNLRPAYQSVRAAVESRADDYEIIIIDDGSTDRTWEIAQDLAAQDARVRIERHPRNLGVDRAFLRGIELANKEHISWVAGNNIVPASVLEDLYDAMGASDMVLSYPLSDSRKKRRRWLSKTFIFVLNVLFGQCQRYYTGPPVYRTVDLKRLRTITHGSMIFPEVIIRLLKGGNTYVEIGTIPQPRTAGKTKTFRVSNITGAVFGVISMFIDIQILRNFDVAGGTRQTLPEIDTGGP